MLTTLAASVLASLSSQAQFVEIVNKYASGTYENENVMATTSSFSTSVAKIGDGFSYVATHSSAGSSQTKRGKIMWANLLGALATRRRGRAQTRLDIYLAKPIFQAGETGTGSTERSRQTVLEVSFEFGSYKDGERAANMINFLVKQGLYRLLASSVNPQMRLWYSGLGPQRPRIRPAEGSALDCRLSPNPLSSERERGERHVLTIWDVARLPDVYNT